MPTNTPLRQKTIPALPVLLMALFLVSMISKWSEGGVRADTGSDRVLFHTQVTEPTGAYLSVGKQNFFKCPGTGEFPLLHGALAQDTQTPFLIYEYTTQRIDPRNAVYPSNGWLATRAWVGEQYPLLRFTRNRIYYVWTTIPLRMQCGKGLSRASDPISTIGTDDNHTAAPHSSSSSATTSNQLCLPCGNGCVLHNPASGDLNCPALDNVQCVIKNGVCKRMTGTNVPYPASSTSVASGIISSAAHSSAAILTVPASASTSSAAPSSIPLMISCPNVPPPSLPEDFIVLREASVETFAGNETDVTVYYRSGFNPHHMEKEGVKKIFGYGIGFAMGWNIGHRAVMNSLEMPISPGDRIRLCGTVGNCSNYVTVRAGPLQTMWMEPGLCPSALWH